MSASISRWQLMHRSARNAMGLLKYAPHWASSAACALPGLLAFCVRNCWYCLGSHCGSLCGSTYFSDGPWHESHVTPSVSLKFLPWRFCGTLRAWQLMHASLLMACALASSGRIAWYFFQISWPLGLAAVRLLKAARCGSFGPFQSVNSLPACLPGALFGC